MAKKVKSEGSDADKGTMLGIESYPLLPPNKVKISGAGSTALYIFFAVLAGCSNSAGPFSDLVSLNSEEITESNVRCSVKAEVTSKSTIEDGRKWFRKHELLIYFDGPEDGGYGLAGTLRSLQAQASGQDLYVELEFDANGNYRFAKMAPSLVTTDGKMIENPWKKLIPN